MSDLTNRDRKRRVQRLKKLILYTLLAAILIPISVSAYLGIRIIQLKAQVKELEQQLRETGEQNHSDSISETQPEGVSADAEGGLTELTEEDSIRAWENMEKQKADVINPQQSGIRKVYLTFDDGPSIYTDEILDILKTYNVKATFFVVGNGKEAYEDTYRRIIEEGHTLGMHSYTHVYADIYSSKEAFVKDVNELQDYLHEVTGVYPEVYRFPGGSSNRAGQVDMDELKAYLDEIDVKWHDWNVSSGDATARLGKDQIVRNSVGALEGYRTAVILLHDSAGKKSTVQALPEIIETILQMDDTVLVPITADTVPIQHGK